MSKHTPGSWQYDGSVGVYRDGDTDDISNLVALVYSSDLMGNIAHNARLISAAPDMAEALRTIVELHLSGTEMSIAAEDPAFVAGRWLEAMEAAIAALKKAGIQ